VVARIIFSVLIACSIAAGIALWRGAIEIPERYDPWATLELDAPPNFLTRYKLGRLSKDPRLCLEVLSTSPFRYEALHDRVTAQACGFFNAVRIEQTGSEVGEPFSLSCRAAVSLALWERHVLQPAALEHFRQSIARIEHYGSYSCRNVYGRPQATRSRHATAEAFDVAGFVLADDTRIRVLGDWDNAGAQGRFLREVRTGACSFFDSVLSPDYNDAHRDHFHFDRGAYRMCR
jgi:hypothetical protein